MESFIMEHSAYVCKYIASPEIPMYIHRLKKSYIEGFGWAVKSNYVSELLSVTFLEEFL